MKNKNPQLTQASKKIIENWHKGVGRVFMSDGTGRIEFDIIFKTDGENYILAFGNSKAIKLSQEQIEKIGGYAVLDN